MRRRGGLGRGGEWEGTGRGREERGWLSSAQRWRCCHHFSAENEPSFIIHV